MRSRTHKLLLTAFAVIVGGGCSETAEPTPTPALNVSFGTSTSFTVQRGQTRTFPVTITRTGGFSGTVLVAVTGLPEGVNVGCSPSAVLGNEATLSVAASASAPLGTFTASARASGSGVAAQTQVLTITVTN
jgi:hypothetical protein